jgi:hypothetical protein
MKRAIAGFLLLVGMAVAPAFAFDGGRNMHRNVREDVRHDEGRVARDRYEYRRDLDRNYYVAAQNENRELRRDYRDVNRDRREFNWNRR